MSKKKCVTKKDVIKIYREDLNSILGKSLLGLYGIAILTILGFVIHYEAKYSGCLKFVDYRYECEQVFDGKIKPYKALSTEIKYDIMKDHSN